MELLRRIRRAFEAEGEVVPPAAPTPMRRIEITVDRRWTTRSVGRDSGEAGDAGRDPGEGMVGRLERPPDG